MPNFFNLKFLDFNKQKRGNIRYKSKLFTFSYRTLRELVYEPKVHTVYSTKIDEHFYPCRLRSSKNQYAFIYNG